MPDFKVVTGRHSRRYNHFREYVFDKCIATNTRLMGVVALNLTWHSRTNNKHILRQVFHLDFSEYGIDEYIEYYNDTDLLMLSTCSDYREFKEGWEETSKGLGGKHVKIPLAIAVRLIEMALEINEKYYTRHEPDIQEFRLGAIERFKLMKEAYLEGPEFTDEYSDEDVIRAVSLNKLSVHETINYFIMRLVDGDMDAVRTVTTIPAEKLEEMSVRQHDIMTLSRNKIKKIKDSDAISEITSALQLKVITQYRCTTLCEEDYGEGYRFIRSVVTLESARGMKDSKVIDFEITHDSAISDFEAAMLLKKPEYITVYKITVPYDQFDLDESPMAANSLLSPTNNGLLCTLYNQDNLHLNSRDYYLEGDVYGYYLITIRGELVIMSSEIVKISVMENDLQYGMLAGKLDLVGRYKFESQVFKNFTDFTGALFEDIIK